MFVGHLLIMPRYGVQRFGVGGVHGLVCLGCSFGFILVMVFCRPTGQEGLRLRLIPAMACMGAFRVPGSIYLIPPVSISPA